MEIKTSNPSPSKSVVFFRRGFSTLLLWGIVATIFTSMQPLAYVGLVIALVIISSLEYFKMLHLADVKCFPRYGLFLALSYCGIAS